MEGRDRNAPSYAWGGWKMPVLHPNDAEYCEYGCPICTRARSGVTWARRIQKVEMMLSGGGCWWGRARQRKYGVRPDQPMRAERGGLLTRAFSPQRQA